jgi:hypothetical protein
MTKLSQLQLLLLVLTVALIGVAIYFVVVAVQQASAASDLESQIADVEGQAATVSSQYDVEALQTQLESLQAELDEAEFPTQEEVENVRVLDLVIDAEHEAGIQVQSFWPEKPTDVPLNGNGRVYTAYVHVVTAMSPYIAGLYQFLDEVESNVPFNTLVMDRVALEFIPATDSEAAYWSMECDIIVYAQD